jgi:hypothetical protein
MQTNVGPVLDFVFKYEGGFVNDPRDPGGATNLGITKRALEAFRGHSVSVDDVRALKRPEAELIYIKNYWKPINGDSLPVGVDLAAMDVSVNSGPGKATKWYSEAKAVSSMPLEQIKIICAKRLSFMQGLRTWSHFGKGWAARVSACEAKALVMAGKALSLHPNTMTKELVIESDKSKTKSSKAAKGAAASGGGGAITTADAATSGHTGKVIAFIMIAALVGMCVVLVIKAMQHQQRADAMDTEAKGVV